MVHALSVSLNKLGDLKYYAQDLESARAFYARALNVRLEATSDFTTLSPQVRFVSSAHLLGLRVIVCPTFSEGLHFQNK